MRKIVVLLIMSLFSLNASSQIDSLKTISLEVEILVNDLAKVKGALYTLFESNSIVPDFFFEGDNQFTTNFVLTEPSYFTFEKEIENWGLINSKKMESVNYTAKLNSLNQEIIRVEGEVAEYKSLLNKVDIKSENHVVYWEMLELAKENLRNQNVLRITI